MRSSKSVYNFIIGKDIKAPFNNLFAVVYGISVMKLPNRNFARFILMVFIVYCLVLRTVYQGRIYNNMKSNQRKPDLASIDEIMEKKYEFYLYETLASRAKNYKFYEMRKVYPNDDIETYRQKTLDPSFRGVVFSYLDQILYLNEKNSKNFSYHICKELFLMNNFVFYFRKNHYLVEEINDRIDRMLMSGVIEHITKNYTNSIFLKHSGESKLPKQLKIEHFVGAFRLLLMFIAISTATFILEMMTKIQKLRCLKNIFNYFQHRMLK